MWGPKMLERPPAIPREEYQERCRRAAAAAKERGLDGLLVWSIGGSRLDSFCDVFYLTNHYATESKTVNLLPHWTGFGHAAAILAIDADPVLCVHKPDWRVDLVAVEDVRGSSDLYALILDSMRELGLTGGRIGLAREEYVPLPFYHALRERFPGAQLVAADEILDEMRLVKSSAEIAHMRHASAVSVEVMNAMLGAAEVGRTDGDLASIGFRVATEHGATPWELGRSRPGSARPPRSAGARHGPVRDRVDASARVSPDRSRPSGRDRRRARRHSVRSVSGALAPHGRDGSDAVG
jgi:Xaa-Pro aminopeptidase